MLRYFQEVEDIKAAMKSLFAKLDTLTHFTFTPKQKSAEVRIVRNVPSIAMEEVAPVGMSSADLLAPAEVVDTDKGDLIAPAERTDTDRKRLRREKKAKKRAAIREKEARQQQKGVGVGKPGGKSAAADKSDKKKDKKGGGEKSMKSSTAFFTALQDEVKAQAEGKVKKPKKEGPKKSLSTLKL
jgi:U3 small nucleolar RNA-associated protein MPP10